MSEPEHKGFSEETCVRCGWRMGSPPLNCNNDDTPHIFPSQAVLQAALSEIVMAEPETFDGKTAWPSFAGRLENIAAVALSRAGIERTTP